MSLPANFPTSLDALANPTATTNRDDSGFELDLVVSRIHDILEALEAKVGIGASTPGASAAVLRRTASGTSAWGQVAAGDYATGSIAAADLAAGLGMVRIQTSGQIGSAQTNFDFNSIPQTYTNLRLYLLARSNASALNENLYLTINGLTTGFYGQQVYGNGTTAGGIENTLSGTSAQAVIGLLPAATAASGLPGSAVIELPGYATTVLGKSWLTTTGVWFGTSTTQLVVRTTAGFYNVASGVTSIRLGLAGGGQFLAGSICALYGIP